MENYKDSSFLVRCVGYTQNIERYFTDGKVYEVYAGRITNDRGFTYSDDPAMKADSDPKTWYLSGWYRFEIVDDIAAVTTSPECTPLSFEEVMGYE